MLIVYIFGAYSLKVSSVHRLFFYLIRITCPPHVQQAAARHVIAQTVPIGPRLTRILKTSLFLLLDGQSSIIAPFAWSYC